MTNEPVELDERRGMNAQKDTEIRRRLHEVQVDQAALHERQAELERVLIDAPAQSLAEAVAKAAEALGAAGQPIAAAATELAAATTLEAARDAFGKLSGAVIAYADTTKAAVGDHVSKVYCPMVKKRWLQKGETVKNPYFGKEMQSCGTIEKS